MAAKGFPYISKDLLDALSKAFPERSASAPDQTLSFLMFEGGKRHVVQFLEARYREQQAATSELPNVLVQ